jgi:hypothetical protein
VPDGLRFVYATLTGRRWPTLAEAVRRVALPELEAAGGGPYALFAPQFGLGSDQLVLMTSWEHRVNACAIVGRTLSALDEVESVEHHVVEPTARPTTSRPPERAGVYVHRWFDLDPANVEEVVDLSAEAWKTFEATFEVEVIGFFLSTANDGGPTRLMLLNWYPSLAAWEASREFDRDPESRRRFLRRAELTTTTRAITTTLILPLQAPGSPGGSGP